MEGSPVTLSNITEGSPVTSSVIMKGSPVTSVIMEGSPITSSSNWRASGASETLSGVTQLKIGDVCLFIYVWTYVCHFVI